MNRNCNEICDILGIYKIKTQEIPRVLFLQNYNLTRPAPHPLQTTTKKQLNYLIFNEG